jgi:hypothetical protein
MTYTRHIFSDEEWGRITPLLPPCKGRPGGAHWAFFNALLRMARTGAACGLAETKVLLGFPPPLVKETAEREGFSRLLVLRLEAGQLAGVDAGALRFALESLAPGTVLDGATFEIGEPVAAHSWHGVAGAGHASLR